MRQFQQQIHKIKEYRHKGGGGVIGAKIIFIKNNLLLSQ